MVNHCTCTQVLHVSEWFLLPRNRRGWHQVFTQPLACHKVPVCVCELVTTTTHPDIYNPGDNYPQPGSKIK